MYDSDQAVITVKADYIQHWDISTAEFSKWEQYSKKDDSTLQAKRHPKGEKSPDSDCVELNYQLNNPRGITSKELIQVKDSLRAFMRAAADLDRYVVGPDPETGWKSDPELCKYR